MNNLIKKIGHLSFRLPKEWEGLDGKNRAVMLDDVVSILEEYERKQPKTDWIPCEEMLPSKEGFYLVTVKKECELKVLCLWYKKEYWLCYQEETGKIIAWQPLPEPYKKEGAE